MNERLTAIIQREGDGYVALCPELDIASQGMSVSEARENLKEAIELFCEDAPAEELQRRLHCAGEALESRGSNRGVVRYRRICSLASRTSISVNYWSLDSK